MILNKRQPSSSTDYPICKNRPPLNQPPAVQKRE